MHARQNLPLGAVSMADYMYQKRMRPIIPSMIHTNHDSHLFKAIVISGPHGHNPSTETPAFGVFT